MPCASGVIASATASTTASYGQTRLDISLIIWTSEEEKESRLRNVLSRQRIPYDPRDFARIERLLVEHGYLTALESWGRIGGYACDFNDDAICDLILAEIYHPKNLKVA